MGIGTDTDTPGRPLLHGILYFLIASLTLSFSSKCAEALLADSHILFKPSIQEGRSTKSDLTIMTMTASDDDHENQKILRVAHLGNSIQYYNDCPRVLQRMLLLSAGPGSNLEVHSDSCLRGGATLTSLLEKGNGMANKFATPNAQKKDGGDETDDDGSSLSSPSPSCDYDIGSPTVQALLSASASASSASTSSSSSSSSSRNAKEWDFVILNDHTQSPARSETRTKSQTVLQDKYLSLFHKNSVVIFIQTAAYRKLGVKNSTDLGTFDNFTDLLRQGYQEFYQPAIPNSKVAPVGDAYQYIRTNISETLWEALYARDDFHPSPHGTLLQAMILYCIITCGQAPPISTTTSHWFQASRYMQPPDTEPLPLPTLQEAKVLRQVACHVCHVALDEDEADPNEEN